MTHLYEYDPLGVRVRGVNEDRSRLNDLKMPSLLSSVRVKKEPTKKQREYTPVLVCFTECLFATPARLVFIDDIEIFCSAANADEVSVQIQSFSVRIGGLAAVAAAILCI